MSPAQEHIIQICQRLTEKGLTPSMALIKSHSTEPLPMQAIIKVLQQWKQDPQSLISQLKKADTKQLQVQQPKSLEKRVELLEEQVAELTAKKKKVPTATLR